MGTNNIVRHGAGANGRARTALVAQTLGSTQRSDLDKVERGGTDVSDQ